MRKISSSEACEVFLFNPDGSPATSITLEAGEERVLTKDELDLIHGHIIHINKKCEIYIFEELETVRKVSKKKKKVSSRGA